MVCDGWKSNASKDRFEVVFLFFFYLSSRMAKWIFSLNYKHKHTFSDGALNQTEAETVRYEFPFVLRTQANKRGEGLVNGRWLDSGVMDGN